MHLFVLLLLVSSAFASPAKLWIRRDDKSWDEVTCSDPNITDAKAAANVRWESADTNSSWKAALSSWQNYKPEGDAVKLEFPAFISDFYGGPEGWDCQDPVNTPCSTTVQCDETKHPAGFNSAIATSFALGKDNTKAAKDSASVQNDLTSAMGALFDVWKKTQADYLSEIFSGSNQTTLQMLDSLIRDGMMNMVPVDINLSEMVKLVQTIMFGQMIPIAWAVAPAAFTPFVLKTGDACSDTMPKTLHPYMTQETHNKTGVCWNGNQFYVLTVGTYRVDVQDDTPGLPDSEPPFQPMSGGTHDVLDGKSWGGITLEDIVISSYSGYLNNGNRNGFNLSLDDSGGAVDQLILAGGIQTPGFFSLPVCTSLWNTLMQIAGSPTDKNYYPCGVEVEKTYPAN
ncbi:glucan endo-1,3-alpha-glucosidase agn1 [Colletotrichum tofieldiae]|uniref:Glucan endo-1,3-alpha-glucosidase agn1 n=1 Tax=Colletotrichum tofieldiae TaxID=708197 RepID=A0A166M8A6_9PEZI|nr:glucan endo-1,3-alpha-glucosidase agn1 [Colletotrichum tofieldiae]